MANTDEFLGTQDVHPIDVVETLAQHYEWDFDRVGEDQIAMAIEGSWRTYSITLAWSQFDETLRMVCTFEMEPPEHRIPQLYHALNEANDGSWSGSFSLWQEQGLMVFRYGLLLGGEATAGSEQIDQMLTAAVRSCERYYPAFQLVCWGDTPVPEAMQIAMGQTYGRA